MIKRIHLTSKKRPVIGILAEPLRGKLTFEHENIQDIKEYIPTAHVQFLE